jgi:multicomponent Na+:H+ antiporter subunit B
MQHHHILRVVTKFNLPLILLFGLYVQFHGDFGPGGGFQAGVIIGAAFILYTLVFGLESGARVTPPHVLRYLSLAGVLIYGGTGVVNLLLGADFLDYGSLVPSHPSHGQHYGILAVEFGVGLTVSSTMVLIFFALGGRGRADEGTDDADTAG